MAVQETTILFTAVVISVCPPNISTFSFLHSVSISFITCSISMSSVPSGASIVTSNPRGATPQEAISLQLIFTASFPILPLAAVIGSVDTTHSCSPKEITLQSSPIPALTRTSSLFIVVFSSIMFFKSWLFNLPAFIINSLFPSKSCNFFNN